MDKLIVSPSPHILSKNSTSRIMLDVILALTPALFASVYFFGWQALVLILTCVVSCVVFEYLCRKLMKRSNTISDLSAVVTGILLAFGLPPSLPVWMAVLGSFAAIVVAKQLFGGIGQNFANPALVGRIILFVSFGTQMTTWALPFQADAVASATPLANAGAYNTMDLFLGSVPGSLGEVSKLALLIGFVYLVIRKVIHPIVPLVYIGATFCLTWAFGADPVEQILSGGLMLGAIFMATDYSSTPITVKGKLIFAFGCALITAAIRIYASYPEGVSFAILFMNLLTPLIDRATKKRAFGVTGGAK